MSDTFNLDELARRAETVLKQRRKELERKAKNKESLERQRVSYSQNKDLLLKEINFKAVELKEIYTQHIKSQEFQQIFAIVNDLSESESVTLTDLFINLYQGLVETNNPYPDSQEIPIKFNWVIKRNGSLEFRFRISCKGRGRQEALAVYNQLSELSEQNVLPDANRIYNLGPDYGRDDRNRCYLALGSIWILRAIEDEQFMPMLEQSVKLQVETLEARLGNSKRK